MFALSSTLNAQIEYYSSFTCQRFCISVHPFLRLTQLCNKVLQSPAWKDRGVDNPLLQVSIIHKFPIAPIL